ncbi:hypothetical protein BDF20DRAFT_865035 [Mycotypha africana]|uniref:uncharacterized protein n=1 Tax=Mycotypha africana TaxID=64632 RepID=UPI00230166E8|nr:uncharacterized protein BDF20DRAFT_865035 [Mycotypha africana]KAI8982120.1 hypothetical protein BDF20DRAFT_865035 [Mycotypha africana]
MSNQSVANNEQTDLKDLARKLSDAYYNTLQYATLDQEQVIHNLQQLAKYSNDLPTSWFTPQLLDTLAQLKSRFITAADLQLKILESIIALYSSWLRRLTSVQKEHQQQLSLVISVLSDVFKMEDEAYRPLQKDAWVGWVSLIGKSTVLDITLLEGMTKVLENFTANGHNIVKNTPFSDTLSAGVAHALAQTSTLNEFEVNHCERLLQAFLHFVSTSTSPKSQSKSDILGIQGPMTVVNTFEHVVDVRSKEEPRTRAEANLSTLVHLVIDLNEKGKEDDLSPNRIAKVAALAGTVRMLQFNQGKKTKKVSMLREEAEEYLLRQVDTIVNTLSSAKYLKQYHAYQDTVTFLVSCFLIQIPEDRVSTLKELPNLLKMMTSTLLTSPETFNSCDIMHRLKVSPDIKDEVNYLVHQSPLFKEIGRISRAMAKTIAAMLQKDSKTMDGKDAAKTIEIMLDRLVGFSYNTFFDWDQYKANTATIPLNPNDTDIMKQIDNSVWTILKSLLFSFTVILKSVAVDVPNGEGLIRVKHAAQDIVSIYANLNFVTEHLPEGQGRQAYEDIMTNAVAYLLNKENSCELNRLISLAFKDYATQKYLPDNTESYELLSMVKQTRLTFFTDLSEQVMQAIDERLFEEDILPVIYPILKWRRIENKALYESAHSCVISAFTSEKAVSKELAGVYGKILIEGFPEPMTLDQLRYGFNTLVQALCEMDDALAWLTVNHLIQKIDSLKANEKNVALRNQYITALIDLLKPLSLGPFFPFILKEIEMLVHSQESKEIQRATMKIVFETVSGPGISDLRRTEAVGWFLDLKHDLKL